MGEPWLDSLSEDWNSEPRLSSPPPSLANSRHGTQGSKTSQSRIPHLAHNMRRSSSGGSFLKPRSSRGIAKSQGYPVLSERSASSMNLPGNTPQYSSLRRLPSSTVPRKTSSNFSDSQQSVQHHTVEDTSKETPEWKRRLQNGEDVASDGFDLFSPSKLEGMFAQPAQSTPDQENQQSFIATDTKPWSSLKLPNTQSVDQYQSYRTNRSRMPPMASLPELNEEEDEDMEKHSMSAISSDLVPDGSMKGLVRKRVDDLETTRKTSPSNDMHLSTVEPKARNLTGDPRWRTLSGQQEIRNEVISPVTASTRNTISTKALRDSVELNPELLKQKLLAAHSNNKQRPSSRSSDHDVSYDGQGGEELSFERNEALQDLTSHSLPEDLSMGTQDFVSHGGYVNPRRGLGSNETSLLRKRFGSLDELSDIQEQDVTSVRFRSSPPPYSMNKSHSVEKNDKSIEESTIPEEGSVLHHETSPTHPASVGSPLKLFGNRDTYTNNKLLRVLSQYEEDRTDSSKSIEEVSQHLDAHSQSANRLRMSQFGQGELDAFNFEKEVDRPSPMLLLPEVEGQKIFQSLADLTIEDEGTVPDVGTAEDELTQTADDPNTKRVPSSPAKDRTPKRRRTLLRDEIVVNGVDIEVKINHVQEKATLAGTKRKDAKPGEGGAPADADTLASRAILMPKLESRKFSSQDRHRSASQNSTIKKTNPPTELTEALAAELASFAQGVSQAHHDSRKPSLATRDYMEEANKVMEFIRARGKPKTLLPEIQEPNDPSELDADQILDVEVEDESTVEPFSRPPSREGPVKPREDRRVAVHDSHIANHLRKFKDSDDLEALASMSAIGALCQRASQAAVEEARSSKDLEDQESSPPNIRILNDRDPQSREKHSSSVIDKHQTNGEQFSGSSSRRTIVTESTSSSGHKGVINSGKVSIPDNVGTMTFDHEKGIWIKQNLTNMAKRKEVGQQQLDEICHEATMDDDPFEDIPDLSIDEQHEAAMKLIPKPSSRPSSANTVLNTHQSRRDSDHAKVQEIETQPKVPLGQDQERSSGDGKGVASNDTDTVRTRSSYHSSSIRSEVSKHEERLHQGLPSKEPASTAHTKLQPRVVTIAFSSPIASEIPQLIVNNSTEASSDEDFLPPDDSDDDVDYLRSPKSVQSPQESKSGQDERHFKYVKTHQSQSLRFERRPVSRIEERDESAIEEEGLSLVCVKHPQTSTPTTANRITTRKPVSAYKGTSILCLTPLSDFTLHQADRAKHPEESFVQERAHPKALLQAHGALALSVDILVKAITDATSGEPFWEQLRKLDLKDSRLQSVHGLQDYCAGLESLDISCNEILQLDGLPSTLRHLNISNNKVNDFASWTDLQNLQYLDASGNELDTLEGFGSLVHLRKLKCGGNNIQDIEGVLDLDGLISLELQDNELNDLDFEGVDMPRLESLDLSNNKLTSVRNLHCLPQLTFLNLKGNSLKELSISEPLSCLKRLIVSENEIHSLDLKMFPVLNELDLDTNCIQTLDGLSMAVHLRTLSIRDQRNSTDIVDLVLTTPNECTSVFLSSNVLSQGLMQLPRFPHYNLQHLEMAACGLRSLPTAFGDFYPNCRVLNLNFNAISDLSPLIGSVKLKELSVAGNRVKRLRRNCLALSRIPGLESIDLRNNPLTVGFYAPLQEVQSELCVLPKRLPAQDLRWLQLMDETTGLRRKMMELLLAEGCKALQELDGSGFQKDLITEHDDIWNILTAKGVLLRAIEAPTKNVDDEASKSLVQDAQVVAE